MSSSGPASPSGASKPDKARKKDQDIPMEFCPECSNLLYSKEDKERVKLMLVCRTCNFSKEATNTCVYRNRVHKLSAQAAGVTADDVDDITRPRVKVPCPDCGHPQSVSVQTQQRDSMQIWYVCCSCRTIFQRPKPPQVKQAKEEDTQQGN